MNDSNEILTRGIVNIIPDKDLLEKLLGKNEKLNVYVGIDPTSTHIHLGHAVVLRKLAQFAQLGHHVIFLIGDFTALIGDTSDKDAERPILSTQQITENFRTYKKQAEKVLDFTKVDVKYNSEWLKHLTFAEIVRLCQLFSANDFLAREIIRKRVVDGKRIGLHEFLYPVMQGYDSYFLNTDIQIGGADQTFNMQAGRTLQKDLREKESFVIATDYLLSTDGRKMSKTWGNAIWLDDTPEDMFTKVMAIHDNLIIQYYTLATSVSLPEITSLKEELENNGHPLNIKKNLARQIVKELYDEEAAELAQSAFEKTVQQKQPPEKLISVHIDREKNNDLLITELLEKLGLTQSLSEAKRLIQQGGVKINNVVITTPRKTIKELTRSGEIFIQVGKYTYRKVIVE